MSDRTKCGGRQGEPDDVAHKGGMIDDVSLEIYQETMDWCIFFNIVAMEGEKRMLVRKLRYIATIVLLLRPWQNTLEYFFF